MGMNRAVTQLSKILGEDRAKVMVKECLGEAGLTDVKTPQELLKFAQSLSKRGGFVEVVGRSLKIQALLAGARMEA
jgi:hypothetical protein